MKLFSNLEDGAFVTADADEKIQYMLDSKKIHALEFDIGASDKNNPLLMKLTVPVSSLAIKCKTTEGRVVKIFNVCSQCGKRVDSCTEHARESPAQSITVAVRDENDKGFGWVSYVKLTAGSDGIPIAEIHQYVIEDGKPVVGEDGKIKTRRL
jgi:hypothetical protein